ncbi:MAG: pyridoxamine 5'-phosphate oxidase family protein [Chloroflexi bacterium]|nr:pyridoxamine 5'-phosphate oxidase family protein [Chloroflexota bacterium]MYE38908.1 pyridoxamine 5'-phosphate oxidase family protein [Chloroflexota bacterium]
MKVHDYHDGNLRLQERFDTRRLADRLKERVSETIFDEARAIIEEARMFFLATCDDRGLPTCSYKGGDPGFVRVVDDATLAFPNYDGNGKYQSMGNLLRNPNVGMLFVDFEGSQRLRIQGVARIEEHDELLSEYPEAQFIVRVDITEVYKNCPRYVHKYRFVEPSEYVPHYDRETPQPAWKSSEELKDSLPRRG